MSDFKSLQDKRDFEPDPTSTGPARIVNLMPSDIDLANWLYPHL
ncbi:MAG: hypothetical protein ACFCD0_22725 [Gemmataceae bacterium]